MKIVRKPTALLGAVIAGMLVHHFASPSLIGPLAAQEITAPPYRSAEEYAATFPADVTAESRSRIPMIRREDLAPDRLPAYDERSSPDTTSLAGLYGPGGLRLHGSTEDRMGEDLGGRLKELIRLIVSREMDQAFEWTVHEPVALREGLEPEIIEIIRRHPREAVIVYCLTRKDTETVAAVLKANGIDAAHYHAGLTSEVRRKTQEAFSEERLDVVVATVAFGMGIDRSDVRCVIHAAMPKSIEHYQQETGRAGRDGLEAECVLLYSAADVMRWQRLIELSAAESGNPEESLAPQRELLKHINGLCTTLECRHQALTRYFGQEYQPPEPPEVMKSGKALDSELPEGSGGCRACDVCLDEVESMPDATMITRKIISCVARMKQGFGVGYLVQVLRGASTQQVRDWKHDDLSTYGLLREIPEKVLTNLVYQLVDQNLLARSGGDRPVVMLNEQSIAVMKGEREVKLIEPRTGPVQKTQTVVESWEGVDKGLFEHLRELRRAIAQERAVPAYVVFGDKTLRSMATIRPASIDSMMIVHGVGEKKLADLGQQFVEAIVSFCVEHDLSTDERDGAGPVEIVRPKPQKKTNPQRGMAFGMFARGASIRDVMEATGRAEVTVEGYLEQFIEERKPGDIAAWVDEATYPKVTAAIDEVGMEALRPIYLKLNEQVSYGEIRAVAAHLRMRSEQD
ncbi:MAG: HRDC domain-containing protein [Planctomycetes bacterium]|nr:HRDC domain-containing protein [Planctomycetota bacterium]